MTQHGVSAATAITCGRVCLQLSLTGVQTEVFAGFSKAVKTPHYIQVGSGAPFAFAGLYELYKDELLSCTVLTMAPNKLMSKLHDWMPVILSSDDYERWLEPSLNKVEDVEDLLQPYPGKMKAHPVLSAVNNSKNNGSELIGST